MVFAKLTNFLLHECFGIVHEKAVQIVVSTIERLDVGVGSQSVKLHDGLDVDCHLASERFVLGIHLGASLAAEWLHVADSFLEAAGVAVTEYWCFCDKSCHSK